MLVTGFVLHLEYLEFLKFWDFVPCLGLLEKCFFKATCSPLGIICANRIVLDTNFVLYVIQKLSIICELYSDSEQYMAAWLAQC